MSGFNDSPTTPVAGTDSSVPPTPHNGSTTSLNVAGETAIPIDLPEHAHAQGHQTLEVTMPADKTSHGQVEHFELQPVGKHEKVRGTVVKDKKTGRHYKKVFKKKTTPIGLGHAKGAPIVKVAPRKGALPGLGHAFASTSAEQPSHHHAGHHRSGRNSQENLNSPTAMMGQAEKQQLFSEMRSIIRAEMKAGGGGGGDTIIVAGKKDLKTSKIVDQIKAAKAGDDKYAGEGTPAGEANKVPSEDRDVGGQGTPAQGTGTDNIYEKDEKKDLLYDSQDTKAGMDLNGGKKTKGDDGSLTTRSSASLSRNSESSSISSYDSDDEDSVTFPNPWAKFRYYFKEELAEALGMFVFITFGTAVSCQVFLSQTLDPSSPKGQYLSVSFGWGIGVGMGVWTCGGKSGGHLNPVVTLSLAIFRGFPWKKVPRYWIAQLFGAFLAALCVYGCYVNPIRLVDPAKTELTASYFTTYPAKFLSPNGARINGWFNEVYGTTILLIVILAIGDSENVAPVDGMAPLVLLWLVTGIGAVFGYQTGYAINPARDLGPRLALWVVGYGTQLWTFNDGYFAYTPLLGSIVGGLLGSTLYDAFIYTGSESPLNKVWKWSSLPVIGKYLRNKSETDGAASSDEAKSIENGKSQA